MSDVSVNDFVDGESLFRFHGYAEDVLRSAVDTGDVFVDTLAIWFFAARFDVGFFERWEICECRPSSSTP